MFMFHHQNGGQNHKIKALTNP